MGCCSGSELLQEEDYFIESIQVNKRVPDLIITTYDPTIQGFSEVFLDKLQEQNKWLVLFFYPSDFTFVCPTELADLANYNDKFKAAGVEIVSMSTDTKFAHLAWRNSEPMIKNVDYQMGEDPGGRIASLFGFYNNETCRALRGTAIIDPDGVLSGIEVNQDGVGRSAAELLRKLEALAYVRANPGEVCPAQWGKGDPTLRPSVDSVGNVLDQLQK